MCVHQVEGRVVGVGALPRRRRLAVAAAAVSRARKRQRLVSVRARGVVAAVWRGDASRYYRRPQVGHSSSPGPRRHAGWRSCRGHRPDPSRVEGSRRSRWPPGSTRRCCWCVAGSLSGWGQLVWCVSLPAVLSAVASVALHSDEQPEGGSSRGGAVVSSPVRQLVSACIRRLHISRRDIAHVG
jgi:hypothetical protein